MGMPTIYRKWFLERYLRELEEKKEQREQNTRSGPDYDSLSKFERKIGMT